MTIRQLLCLVVLLGPVWLPLRLLRIRGSPPGSRILLSVVIAAWAAVVAWLTIARPSVALFLAILVVAAWALMTWRARPSAGRNDGRPPGSLGLRSSIRALSDYGFYEKEAARFGPVFKSNQYYRPVLCVVGLERCQRFLRENRERLSSAPLPIDRHITGGLLRYMDPGAHAEYRTRLQSCMKASALAECGPLLEELAAREFSVMADVSRGRPSGVRSRVHVDRLVFLALNRIFFGFAPDDSAVARLARLYRVVDHRRLWRDSTRTRHAIDAIVEIVRQRGRAESPPPSGFLRHAIRQDGDPLSDAVFVENLAYFLHIARCDLTGLCGWLLKMLLDHPQWRERIRLAAEEGEGVSGATAAERFVDETLRLRQSEYLYRTTSAPIECEGFAIPQGWLVRLCIRESHTTADAFDRPKEFDPDRFLGTTYPPERYQPFGIYEHACVGAALTKLLGRIFVEGLSRRFDVTAVRDGPMELGLHHHGHWAPSSRLAVRLTPRSA